MYKYVKSAQSNNVVTVPIDIIVIIGEKIAAAYNPNLDESVLDEEIGEIIDEYYNNFIKVLYNQLYKWGFENLEPEERSNQEDSYSRYFTFCRKDEYDTLTVKFIIYLRVSDHRLTKRKGKNRTWDRLEAKDVHQKAEIETYYAELNEADPTSIENVNIEVKVTGQLFHTFRDAINHIRNRLSKYM